MTISVNGKNIVIVKDKSTGLMYFRIKKDADVLEGIKETLDFIKKIEGDIKRNYMLRVGEEAVLVNAESSVEDTVKEYEIYSGNKINSL